jgi:hypothetical protein
MRKKQDNEPKNILRKSFFILFSTADAMLKKASKLGLKVCSPLKFFFFFKNFFLFWWTWTRQFTLRQFDRDSYVWYLVLRHSSDTSKCMLKLLLGSSKFRNKSSTFRKNYVSQMFFFFILSFQLYFIVNFIIPSTFNIIINYNANISNGHIELSFNIII